MLDPCGPEMTAILWSLVRGIFCGLMTGGLLVWLDATKRRLLGEPWQHRSYTPEMVCIVTVLVTAFSVFWEMYRQFG